MEPISGLSHDGHAEAQVPIRRTALRPIWSCYQSHGARVATSVLGITGRPRSQRPASIRLTRESLSKEGMSPLFVGMQFQNFFPAHHSIGSGLMIKSHSDTDSPQTALPFLCSIDRKWYSYQRYGVLEGKGIPVPELGFPSVWIFFPYWRSAEALTRSLQSRRNVAKWQ